MLFTKIGYGILIPINKSYTVRANINCIDRDANKYTYNYEITRNDIGKFDTIGLEDANEIESISVNVDVAKATLAKYKEGFFKNFIERYEYELKCTDAGIELDEKERLGV